MELKYGKIFYYQKIFLFPPPPPPPLQDSLDQRTNVTVISLNSPSPLFLSLQEDGYADAEADGKVQEESLQKFSSRDYIMEPTVFNTLKT